MCANWLELMLAAQQNRDERHEKRAETLADSSPFVAASFAELLGYQMALIPEPEAVIQLTEILAAFAVEGVGAFEDVTLQATHRSDVVAFVVFEIVDTA